MNVLLLDFRFAARALAKRPGFTLIAVLTLALGIGATTAIFSVVGSVLLQPLPYEAPERVVQVWNPWSNEPGVRRGRTSMSSLDLAEMAEAIDAFERLGAYDPPTTISLTGDGTPERILASRVSAGAFAVLGTTPALGRTFTPEEDAPGGNRVAVLSHGTWQRRFGGDASALGSSIRLDGVAYTIVGVMPPRFRMPEDFGTGQATEVWTPLALDIATLDRSFGWLHAVARLAPGASIDRANAELAVLTRGWIEQGLKIADLPPYYAVPIDDEILGGIRPALWLLFGAVVFVLLIACVNVANLLLARADGRRSEMALRTALGAGRWRLVAQLLTESTLLALVGGTLGLLLAFVAIDALVALGPAGLPRLEQIRIDVAALGFAIVVTLLTGILAGVAPALQASRSNVAVQLRGGSRSVSGGRDRQRFRGALVATEVALSVALLIGAVLMIRTVWQLSQIDLGFRTDRVLTFGISLPNTDYPDAGQRVAFFRELVQRLDALPGASSAGAISSLPLVSGASGGSIQAEGSGSPGPGESWPNSRWQVVTPGYFETMGYGLLAGRLLEASDDASALPATVVNETMAEMLWPGRSALGQRVRNLNSDVPWFTVVGVTRDVRQSGVTDTPSPTMYIAHEQYELTRTFTPSDMSVVLGTASNPASMVSAVRGAVGSMDPDLPISDIRSMAAIVSDAIAQPRFTMLLLGIFGSVALALAMTGIYGVLSYAVSQRRREIGIRIALGASHGRVLRLVVGEGIRLVAGGLVAGVLAALLLTRLMASLVYGIRPVDPATFLAVPALFALVALGASFVPAQRAARADPALALRHD